MKKIYWLMGLLIFSCNVIASPVTICAYDPSGEGGTIANFATKLSDNYRELGLEPKLKVFKNDLVIRKKFQTNNCDAMFVIGFMVRNYNRFSSSLEAFGLIQKNEQIEQAFELINRPELADQFSKDGYEVTGVFPLGLSYLVSTHSRANNIEELNKKSFFINRKEPALTLLSKELAMNRVHGNSKTFIPKLQRQEVDYVLLPLLAVDALDLYKKIAQQGQIINMPIRLLTMQMIINQKKFPKGFGKQARLASTDYSRSLMRKIRTIEEGLKPLLKPLSAEEKKQWDQRLQAVQEKMVNEGHYSPELLHSFQ